MTENNTKNIINIVCVIYDDNIDYIKTTLFSLIINKEQNIQYNIYCLTEIEYSFDFLRRINNHVSIKQINLNKISNEYNIKNKENFKYNCIYYLDQILPEVKRIIYINHEIIFKKSLQDIWKINLENDQYIACIGGFNREIYTNLILIDLLKIRKQDLNYDYIIRMKSENLNKKNIINELKDHIKILSFKYLTPNINEIQNYYLYNGSTIKAKIDYINEINNSLCLCYVKKPWEHHYVLFGDIWKQYYKECIYIENLKLN